MSETIKTGNYLKSDTVDLEVIEEYIIEGQRRYRVKLKGTNIIVNVEAQNDEEALQKVAELMVKLKMV